MSDELCFVKLPALFTCLDETLLHDRHAFLIIECFCAHVKNIALILPHDQMVYGIQ